MKSPARRTALIGACATVATLLVKAEAVADNSKLTDIQTLVFDLRNVSGSIPMCVFVAFQEMADRLETLPGVEPVTNEMWLRWKAMAVRDRIGPYLTAGRA